MKLLFLFNLKRNSNSTYIFTMLKLFIIYVFKRLIFFIFGIPYIVLKNNNYITKIIYKIFYLNVENFSDYLNLIFFNISVQTIKELVLQTTNLNIIFNEPNIIFNMKSGGLNHLIEISS